MDDDTRDGLRTLAAFLDNSAEIRCALLSLARDTSTIGPELEHAAGRAIDELIGYGDAIRRAAD